MTDAWPSRKPLIAALYEAFADAPVPEALEYCSYCDTEAYARALLEPLGSLPRELVDKYLRDAIHHTGTADDFPHFVPRILELEDTESLDGFRYFGDRLKACAFPDWPEARRTAVLRVLEAVAIRGERDIGWLAVLADIAGIDWLGVFERWPGQDDPRSKEAGDLETAIYCRSLDTRGISGEDAAKVDALWAAFLDSPPGVAFSEAHLARLAAARGG
jgi:hypothetical protein